MLLLLMMLGVGLGWLAHEVELARAERAAAKAVQQRGGQVLYAPASGGIKRTTLTWVGKLFGENLPANVTVVAFFGSVTDAELEHLRELTELRLLFLERTRVTDAGLEHLQGLTQLQFLSLNGTQVTDAGLEHVRELTKLVGLDLANTQVSDVGLANLQGLTHLEVLSLGNTQVTDAGADEFKKAVRNVRIGH